jgi:hypothetical protein
VASYCATVTPSTTGTAAASVPNAFAAFVTTVGNAVVNDYVNSVDEICIRQAVLPDAT